jgi:hypothetical protein
MIPDLKLARSTDGLDDSGITPKAADSIRDIAGKRFGLIMNE